MTKIKTTAAAPMTKGQTMAADIAALLRARNPLIWIVTREEARAERHVFEAAAAAGYVSRTWDVGQGICEMNGTSDPKFADSESPDTALMMINRRATAATKSDRCVFVLRDMHAWVSGPAGARSCRLIRNLSRLLPTVETDFAQAMVVISPSAELPPELAGHAVVLDWALPDRAEIAAELDAVLENQSDKVKAAALANDDERERAIDAAVGLTGEEASATYAKSLVLNKRIDPLSVAQEKKRIITRERVLEWYDPIPGGLDAVGGLDNLKAWLMVRLSA